MSDRTPEQINSELQALNASHTQNEAGRDAFVALAHTALFAASVSFFGSLAPVGKAIWLPSAVLGWLSSVVGLVALTVSFVAAQSAINARIQAIHEADYPRSNLCDVLNNISLWSFPVSLFLIFTFVTGNVIHANEQKSKPASTPACANQAGAGSRTREQGRFPAPASAGSRRLQQAGERRGAGTASPGSPATAATPTHQEIGLGKVPAG